MPTQPYVINGQRVPSVTTILSKFKDPGGLMWWAWQTANDVLLEAHSLIEKNGNEDAASYLRRKQKYLASKPLERANFRKESQAACTAGTVAHDLVGKWIEDEKREIEKSVNLRFVITQYQVDKEIATSAINGYRAFVDWAIQNRFDLQKVEMPLLSHEHLFGGTLDCLGKLHSNRRILFDWKTSGALYTDYLLQIAAYAILWDENNSSDPVTAAHLVRFDKETADFCEYRFTDLSQPKEMFLLLRAAYELLKQIEKRIK